MHIMYACVYMYVCRYADTYILMYVCMCVHKCAHMFFRYACVCALVSACMRIYARAHICVCIYLFCIHVSVYRCMTVTIYTYVGVCVSVCGYDIVYIYMRVWVCLEIVECMIHRLWCKTMVLNNCNMYKDLYGRVIPRLSTFVYSLFSNKMAVKVMVYIVVKRTRKGIIAVCYLS